MKKTMDRNEFKDRHEDAVENALDERLIWKNIKAQRESEEEKEEK